MQRKKQVMYARQHERQAMKDALEMAVLTSVSHPNIIQVYSCFTDMVEDAGETCLCLGTCVCVCWGVVCGEGNAGCRGDLGYTTGCLDFQIYDGLRFMHTHEMTSKSLVSTHAQSMCMCVRSQTPPPLPLNTHTHNTA
jgi:hypothetical protein